MLESPGDTLQFAGQPPVMPHLIDTAKILPPRTAESTPLMRLIPKPARDASGNQESQPGNPKQSREPVASGKAGGVPVAGLSKRPVRNRLEPLHSPSPCFTDPYPQTPTLSFPRSLSSTRSGSGNRAVNTRFRVAFHVPGRSELSSRICQTPLVPRQTRVLTSLRSSSGLSDPRYSAILEAAPVSSPRMCASHSSEK